MQYTVTIDANAANLSLGKLHMLAIECCCDTYGSTEDGCIIFVFDDKQNADDFDFYVAADAASLRRKKRKK